MYYEDLVTAIAFIDAAHNALEEHDDGHDITDAMEALHTMRNDLNRLRLDVLPNKAFHCEAAIDSLQK